MGAAQGNSYALELGPLKNGIFTYSFIRAIALYKAGLQMQGYVSASNSLTDMQSVKEFLKADVLRVSGGRSDAQHPFVQRL